MFLLNFIAFNTKDLENAFDSIMRESENKVKKLKYDSEGYFYWFTNAIPPAEKYNCNIF